MYKKTILLFITLLTLGGMISCGDDKDILDPTAQKPTITFAYDMLEVDMNLIDNLPVVAVIRSALGLQNVKIQIETFDNSIVDYKEITEFFDENSFSYSEKFNYNEDYKAIILTATDKLNRSTTETLEMEVIGKKEAPTIVFDPSSIVYDEAEGLPMPITSFTVNSVAGLKSLEMFLVSEEGQSVYGFTIDFSDGETEYTFSEQVMYKDGDKGFRVKVTDIYGQVKIGTLPVLYLTPAPPVVTVSQDTIYAEKDEVIAIPLEIESERGVSEIKIYRIEGVNETLSEIISMDDYPTELNISPEVKFTNSTSKVRIEVIDKSSSITEVSITAIVNMNFVASLEVGSQPLANGYNGYPDVYALLSLKDFETYSVDYAVASEENASNIDLKFYAFGGQAVLRFYSPDGGTGTKSNEFRGSDGKSAIDMAVQNSTRFLKLTNYDFDNATAESIANDIPLSNIVSNNINPLHVGDVVAFRTASTSTSGGDRVGIIKVLDDKQVNPNNVTARVINISIKFPK